MLNQTLILILLHQGAAVLAFAFLLSSFLMALKWRKGMTDKQEARIRRYMCIGVFVFCVSFFLQYLPLFIVNYPAP